MKQYRINTDIIDLEWVIFRKYELPENFDDPEIIRSSIKLQTRHRQNSNIVIDLPFVYKDGNRLQIQILAENLNVSGEYDLFLQYQINDDIVKTYTKDYCKAFELVDKSCKIAVPEDKVVYEGIMEELRGLSAYEVAVKNGFQGTEQEWLDSLKCGASGSGDVSSVNGKKGDIILNASDVGALPVNTPLFSGNYNDLSDKPVIPTKVSELDNDFGYIVVESDPTVPDWAKQLTKPTYSKAEIELGNVDNIQQASKSEFDSHSNNNSIHVTDSDKTNWNNKANVGDIPSSISQLDNDEEFIKNTVSNLTNYYLKSETYTRQEVQDLVSSVQSVQIQSVEVLPAIGESNIIYLVPKAGGTANNIKDEYIWIDNNWEHIGTTEINLTWDIVTGKPSWITENKPSYSYSEITGTKPPTNAQKNSDITKAEIEAKLTGNIVSHSHTVTKSDIGLSNVDNTSDANKPISTAVQTALDGKANTSHTHSIDQVTGLQTAINGKFDIPTGTTSQYLRGNGTVDSFPVVMGESEINTGTSTTGRLVSAQRLNNWLNSKNIPKQVVVSELPSSPDPDTFYFITE